MLTGYFIAKALQLNLPQTLSISIESGIQNGTLAIVIASSILQNADMSLPAAIYSLPMFLTGGIMMYYFGKRKAVND
jgi:BASS family bile acid:Na+ symporter